MTMNQHQARHVVKMPWSAVIVAKLGKLSIMTLV